MKANIIFFFFCLLCSASFGQNFTSYFTGNSEDFTSEDLKFSLTVMGGGNEVDDAMQLFLNDAKGGDVVVLRTSGSDGYNDYLYSELIGNVNSVETIVCHSREASFDPYVLERILRAEAIWFAGGDQWEYLSYWRDTPLQQYLNFAVLDKGIPIGGTSAGMAILGNYQFTAENGTVTSEQALADPYNERMTIDNRPFIFMPLPVPIIFDSHFDDPDRRGRMAAFIARIKKDYGEYVMGIALDEFTSARFTGGEVVFINDSLEEENDFAHIFSYNCQEESESFIVDKGQPLTWSGDQLRYRIYRAYPSGLQGIILSNNWSNLDIETNYIVNINDGKYVQIDAPTLDEFPIPCAYITATIEIDSDAVKLSPNPASSIIDIASQKGIDEIKITSLDGTETNFPAVVTSSNHSIDISKLESGIYVIKMRLGGDWVARKFVKL